jgi:hypothetical protein
METFKSEIAMLKIDCDMCHKLCNTMSDSDGEVPHNLTRYRLQKTVLMGQGQLSSSGSQQ